MVIAMPDHLYALILYPAFQTRLPSAGDLDDPPYSSDELEKLLEALGESSLVIEDGRVVVEHHHKLELRERYCALELTRRLKAGESCFTLYARVC